MSTTIRFNVDNRYYNLKFNLPEIPIVCLQGDSSTGKSLLWDDFVAKQHEDSNLKNSLAVNIYGSNDDLYDRLKQHTYNIVLIDNADILVTPEIDNFIKNSLLDCVHTRWILIGREVFSCMISLSCRGKLVKKTDNRNRIRIGIQYPSDIGW